MKRPSGLLLAAALAAFVALPIAAQPAPKESSTAAPLGQLSSVADQAFRAWLDTTDLGRMIKRDHSQLKTMKLKDGTVAVIMGESFRSVIVAEEVNGDVKTICISTPEDAKAVFKEGKAPLVREP